MDFNGLVFLSDIDLSLPSHVFLVVIGGHADRNDDDRSKQYFIPVGWNSHQYDRIGYDGHQGHSQECSQNRSGSSLKTGASQYNGCNDIQLFSDDGIRGYRLNNQGMGNGAYSSK